MWFGCKLKKFLELRLVVDDEKKQEQKRWEEERNINSRRRRRQEARPHPLGPFFSQEKVGPSEVLIGSSGADESENGGASESPSPSPSLLPC